MPVWTLTGVESLATYTWRYSRCTDLKCHTCHCTTLKIAQLTIGWVSLRQERHECRRDFFRSAPPTSEEALMQDESY